MQIIGCDIPSNLCLPCADLLQRYIEFINECIEIICLTYEFWCHTFASETKRITLQNLRRSEDVPQDLFGAQKKSEAKDVIERVGDLIRKKFGHNALKRASSLKGQGRKRGNSFPGTR